MGRGIQEISSPDPTPDRVLVVGVTNAGKTTLARRISDLLDLPYIELDELFWGPNWTQRTTEEFRESFSKASEGGRWAACGNYYGRLHDLTWKQADWIVFLDLPGRVTFFRMVRRTLKRILLREQLWHGNRESFRNTFFAKDSLLLWWVKVQRLGSQHTLSRLETASQAKVIRLRSRREVREFLEGLSSRYKPPKIPDRPPSRY